MHGRNSKQRLGCAGGSAGRSPQREGAESRTPWPRPRESALRMAAMFSATHESNVKQRTRHALGLDLANPRAKHARTHAHARHIVVTAGSSWGFFVLADGRRARTRCEVSTRVPLESTRVPLESTRVPLLAECDYAVTRAHRDITGNAMHVVSRLSRRGLPVMVLLAGVGMPCCSPSLSISAFRSAISVCCTPHAQAYQHGMVCSHA